MRSGGKLESVDVTIVIPTFGRSRLLARAIESCFVGSFSNRTEVVVVPNGQDFSWKLLESRYERDCRVRFHPIELADQSSARNAGLEAARGVLVRFLDDDDYLIPEAAEKQYAMMLDQQLDVTGAGAEIKDKDDVLFASIVQPESTSFEEAVLSRKRIQLPFAWVFRRSSFGDCRWPVGVRQSEDIVWLIEYMKAAPRRWARLEDSVGVWYQHDGPRQSLDRPSGFVHEVTARALLECGPTLVHQNRWSVSLAHTTAGALLELVHRAFPFRPLYWSRIAGSALRMDSSARASQRLYTLPVLRRIDPRVLLWLFLPKRLVALGWDFLKGAFKGRNYRRKL